MKLHKKGNLDARADMNGKGVSEVEDWSETDTNIRKKQTEETSPNNTQHTERANLARKYTDTKESRMCSRYCKDNICLQLEP